MKKKINGETLEYQVQTRGNEIALTLNGESYNFKLVHQDDNSLYLKNDQDKIFKILKSQNLFSVNGETFEVTSDKYSIGGGTDHHEGEMISPMPGKIISILVELGQEVKKGDKLIIMEAMKMEHTIVANENGIIKEICCEEGGQVDGGVELIGLEV